MIGITVEEGLQLSTTYCRVSSRSYKYLGAPSAKEPRPVAVGDYGVCLTAGGAKPINSPHNAQALFLGVKPPIAYITPAVWVLGYRVHPAAKRVNDAYPTLAGIGETLVRHQFISLGYPPLLI